MLDYINGENWHNGESIILKYDYKVFVEGSDDELFWGRIFSEYCKTKIFNFEFLGEKATVLKQIENELNTSVVYGAVDADYDYLKNNEKVTKNPKLFHTYTYSIENYCCLPSTIAQLIREIFDANSSLDFNDFFIKYSDIVYPILQKNVSENKTINCFNNDESFEDKFFEKLQEAVNNEIKTSKFDGLEAVNKKNAYLFVNGHDLFTVCKRFISYHTRRIKREKMQQIKDKFEGDQKQIRINEINNQFNKNIDEQLKLNYLRIFNLNKKIKPLQLLKEDIKTRLCNN